MKIINTTDLNGNIKRLIRTDSIGVNSADYKYPYKGNQLNQINELTAYAYDKNGITTTDGLRNAAIADTILDYLKYTVNSLIPEKLLFR